MNFNIFKKNARLDRASFWLLLLFLFAVKFGIFFAAQKSPGNSVFTGLDVFLVIAIASSVAARFRDIGWRPWIGATIVILCMLGLPFAVLAGFVAFNDQFFVAANMPSALTLADLMSAVSVGSLGAVAVLVVVAGVAKGSPEIASQSPQN